MIRINKTMPLLLDLIRWKIIDLIRFFKKENQTIHLYGIYGYLGLPGFGKTMSMSHDLIKLREKYGDKIYIMTNYGFLYEDDPFIHWEQLLKTYDKPVIFAWDEVQNEFNSRDFKKFPVELLTLLTQNRKGNGKRILWTAQRWNRVDKVFRELSMEVAECKTRFGRLTSARWYDWEDYEQLHTTTQIEQKIKIHSKRRDIFVQSDTIRNSYNHLQQLKSAISKEYIDFDDVRNKQYIL